MLAPTERFSSRVENYVRYRPGYPAQILELLRNACNLSADSVVADIGSGTGKLTEVLLGSGCRVFGVEPNREMREAGERLLKDPRFTSVAASAETTTLQTNSVDLIVAGQAFHWFDREKSRAEFLRILKPDGQVVLIWNDRRTDATPFLAAYEGLLREFATDYEQVNHRNLDSVMLSKFFRTEPRFKKFCYAQHFDFEGLKGRLLSSSYAPEAGQPGHDAMLGGLREVFDTHQKQGQVAFEYDTLVYYGSLA
ncbi:MAG TPA: class I SAM-dependent methyltransferase [Verrucomicrobiae bacterium]|nr:class I SAM-dependent methyltransferase [Verrucomicrobiae bacterium]